jgi:ferredoxin--NADP+ reductase
MEATDYNATVIGKMLVTPDLMILRVHTDEPRENFKAGQYTVVGLYGAEPRSANSAPETDPTPPGKLVLRPYSIASALSRVQEFEFYISQVKSGQLTPRLFQLELGGRLHVGKRIIGVFTLADTPPEADIVMVATGTGLAPYICFLRSHVNDRPNSKMAVIHGAAKPWDLGYFSELTFLASTFPNFYYLPTLTHADHTWAGHRLWIEDFLVSGELERATGIQVNPDKTHFFLCGNPTMVEKVTQILSASDYQRHSRQRPGSLHVEEFKSR